MKYSQNKVRPQGLIQKMTSGKHEIKMTSNPEMGTAGVINNGGMAATAAVGNSSSRIHPVSIGHYRRYDERSRGCKS